jgi:hypothetical protein
MNFTRIPASFFALSPTYAEFAKRPAPRSLRRIFRQKHGVSLPAGATVAYAIALALSIRAISGDVAACHEIREAAEGRAQQRDVVAINREVRLLIKEVKSPILNPQGLPRDEIGNETDAV